MKTPYNTPGAVVSGLCWLAFAACVSAQTAHFSFNNPVVGPGDIPITDANWAAVYSAEAIPLEFQGTSATGFISMGMTQDPTPGATPSGFVSMVGVETDLQPAVYFLYTEHLTTGSTIQTVQTDWFMQEDEWVPSLGELAFGNLESIAVRVNPMVVANIQHRVAIKLNDEWYVTLDAAFASTTGEWTQIEFNLREITWFRAFRSEQELVVTPTTSDMVSYTELAADALIQGIGVHFAVMNEATGGETRARLDSISLQFDGFFDPGHGGTDPNVDPEPIVLALTGAAQVPGTRSVEITYDLELPESMESAFVWLEYSVDGEEYEWLEGLEGAVDQVEVGSGLTVVWDVESYFPQSTGMVWLRVIAEGEGGHHWQEVASEPLSVAYDTRIFTLFVESYPYEGGQVTVSPMQSTYTWGDTVNIQAVAAPDHQFAGWQGAVQGGAAPLTLTFAGEDNELFLVAYWEFRLASSFLEVWPSAVALGNGWQYVRWFEYFWAGQFYPWIFHEQHGWLFVHAARGSSIWFFDIDPMMGWWFTSDSLYPYLFRSWDEALLYFYAEGSTHGARWFYNYQYYPEPSGWELIGETEHTQP